METPMQTTTTSHCGALTQGHSMIRTFHLGTTSSILPNTTQGNNTGPDSVGVVTQIDDTNMQRRAPGPTRNLSQEFDQVVDRNEIHGNLIYTW
nr:hypothetical protein Iba_chr04cCG14020 [Ipomoea batatas]GMC89530.1 hypothetical protein Iba_chr04eCG20290 [Ipomoea batatas]